MLSYAADESTLQLNHVVVGVLHQPRSGVWQSLGKGKYGAPVEVEPR